MEKRNDCSQDFLFIYLLYSSSAPLHFAVHWVCPLHIYAQPRESSHTTEPQTVFCAFLCVCVCVCSLGLLICAGQGPYREPLWPRLPCSKVARCPASLSTSAPPLLLPPARHFLYFFSIYSANGRLSRPPSATFQPRHSHTLTPSEKGTLGRCGSHFQSCYSRMFRAEQAVMRLAVFLFAWAKQGTSRQLEMTEISQCVLKRCTLSNNEQLCP